MYTVDKAGEEKIYIVGPAGKLEANVLGLDSFLEVPNVGIVCHPHPLHQGTMHNKVVTTVTRTWQKLGLATVRFNFRGVGESEGHYGEGKGEIEDLKAIITFIQQRHPQAKIWLAGFSFGAVISAMVASHIPDLAGLLSMAPAVTFFDFTEMHKPKCPWLIIHGEEDELVPVEAVKNWYELFKKQKNDENYLELIILSDTTHLFHNRLNDLKIPIENFMIKFLS